MAIIYSAVTKDNEVSTKEEVKVKGEEDTTKSDFYTLDEIDLKIQNIDAQLTKWAEEKTKLTDIRVLVDAEASKVVLKS